MKIPPAASGPHGPAGRRRPAPAAALALLLLLRPALADEGPVEPPFPPDPEPAVAKSDRAGAWRRAPEASGTLAFEVPLGKTSRLAVSGERIISAVYDRASLDVKTESSLGQLFVLPLVPGEAAVYVTTESGASIPVILTATEGIGPQNLVLARSGGSLPAGSDTRASRMLEPLPVSDYVSGVKRLVRHVLLGTESPDVLRRGVCPPPSASVAGALGELAPLGPKRLSCWSTTGMSATLVRVKNTRLGRADISPGALAGGTVLAAAVERTTLAPGASSAIVLVEPGHDE